MIWLQTLDTTCLCNSFTCFQEDSISTISLFWIMSRLDCQPLFRKGAHALKRDEDVGGNDALTINFFRVDSVFLLFLPCFLNLVENVMNWKRQFLFFTVYCVSGTLWFTSRKSSPRFENSSRVLVRSRPVRSSAVHSSLLRSTKVQSSSLIRWISSPLRDSRI